MSAFTLEQEAQILADNIVQSTLEAELQDCKNSLAEIGKEDHIAVNRNIAVLELAISLC